MNESRAQHVAGEPRPRDVAGAGNTTLDRGLRAVVPFRFACHRCGHCCSGGSGHVWLEDGEVERMSAFLGATPESFVRRHVRAAIDPRTGRERLALREADEGRGRDSGGRCALLVGRNTCSVYDARPAHCADFPYWDSVTKDVAGFEAARATCPGIAVVVERDVSERAFAALERWRARLEPRAAPSRCCLDRDAVDATPGEANSGDATYASALEADYALAAEPRPFGACRLGDRAPLSCRFGEDGEALRAGVRAIERETGYPAAYSELASLLAGRGFDASRATRGAAAASTAAQLTSAEVTSAEVTTTSIASTGNTVAGHEGDARSGS